MHTAEFHRVGFIGRQRTMLKPARLLRIDLNLLVLFHTVLACGHVGRAAEQLHITPSAVSHGLRRLRRLLKDPLFLKNPRGVSPTNRALALREPVAEILARVEGVVSAAHAFDPGTAQRRFTIGAPDAVAAVFTAPLMAILSREAPGIDLRIVQLMPRLQGRSASQAWQAALRQIDQHELDFAVLPIALPPPRFESSLLFEEDFVVVTRKGHPLSRKPSLKAYLKAQHLLVSASGDDFGSVDAKLEKMGHTRRVVLTVPNFTMALMQVADSNLIATLPRHLVSANARRFNLATCRVPLDWTPDPVRVVASRAALADEGVAWMFAALARSSADRDGRSASR